MPKHIATRVYDIYGRFYDAFEWLFRKRLAKLIDGIPIREGDQVLDIGIGTGLSLEFYPPHTRVTGIDISTGMLRQATRKLDRRLVRADSPRSATQLIRADALNLPFLDASFDAILISHTIATVADPCRCLREAIRVARDGAFIGVLNHFRSPWPVLNWLEFAIDPICRKLGWHTDLGLAELLASAQIDPPAPAQKFHGWMFQIVYLQKLRGSIRVVQRNLIPKLLPSESSF